VPKDPLLTVHWLAVDGVAPRTKHNVVSKPQPVDVDLNRKASTRKFHAQMSTRKNFAGDVLDLRPRRLRRRRKSVDEDVDDDYDDSSESNDEDSIHEQVLEVVHTDEIRQLLSKEHQVYLNQVKGIIRNALAAPRAEDDHPALLNVLESLRDDPSSAQLTPYLLHFAANEIRRKLRTATNSLKELKVLVSLLTALVQNKFLRLYNYIHQILHPLLNIVLHPLVGGVALSDKSVTLRELTLLRRQAAQAVAYVTFKGKNCPPVVLARICEIYRQYLHNFITPMPSMLGAVLGIRALGGYAVRVILLPVFPLLVAALEAVQDYELLTEDSSPSPDSERRKELRSLLVRELMGSVGDALYPSGAARFSDFLPAFHHVSEVEENLRKALIKLAQLSSDQKTPSIAAGVRKMRACEQKQKRRRKLDMFPDDIEQDRGEVFPQPKPASDISEVVQGIVNTAKETKIGNSISKKEGFAPVADLGTDVLSISL